MNLFTKKLGFLDIYAVLGLHALASAYPPQQTPQQAQPQYAPQYVPPVPYYDPFYLPPDPNLMPGETEANDIYKANQHRPAGW